MAIWLLNPPKKRKARRPKVATKRRKRKSGAPSRKQLAARRKFAAAARARSKAARKSTTTRKRRSPVMAKRRRRKATTAVKRRRRPRRSGTMASVTRGGVHVGRKSWRASGYRRNPRRRRRNPLSMGGIGGEIMSLGKQTVAVMAGRYLGRTVTAMIPFASTSPYVTAAKGVAVALLIKRFGRKVVSGDLADALAIGALLGPMNDLIVSVAPQAAGFLSGGPIGFATFPSGVSSYARMGSYSGTDSDDSTYVGSYSNDAYNQ